MKWEYLFLTDINQYQVEKELDLFGSKKWELVGFTETQSSSGPRFFSFVFKRPLEEK